jgi:SAP domain
VCRPLDALPPQTLCELFMVLYSGPFDGSFIDKLQPNAAMLGILPDSIAAEFSDSADDRAGHTRAWMSACLHFFPEIDHPIMSTFRHARPGLVSAKSAKPESLTVIALKEQLVDRGLKVTGKKAELIDRLLEHDSSVDALESPVEVAIEAAAPAEASAAPQNDHASPSQATPAAAVTADAPESADDAAFQQTMLQQMTVPQLKELLRDNNLKVSGKKADLVDRCLANGLTYM